MDAAGIWLVATATAMIADFAMSVGVGSAIVEPEDVPAENTGSTDDF